MSSQVQYNTRGVVVAQCSLLLLSVGYTPKGIKAKGIKAKGIKAFCKPKGIKGPKVLKVVPKQETEIPKVLKVSVNMWFIFGTDQRY